MSKYPFDALPKPGESRNRIAETSNRAQVKNQSLAFYFYATRHELFRCGSPAIADDCGKYLQRFCTPVFTGPPVCKKISNSGKRRENRRQIPCSKNFYIKAKYKNTTTTFPKKQLCDII